MPAANPCNEKPAFRNAMRRRRCLLPADGFYEWKVEGSRKRPFCIRPKNGGPIAFAGLWETWMGPNGEETETAAIITTAAGRGLAGLHDRMPVILPPDAFDLWLDCGNVEAATATALFLPAREGLLEAYEVSTAVNRTANDGPTLIVPMSAQSPAEPLPARKTRPKKDDGQASLF